MSTIKSKKLQVGTDTTSSNNFTIYQPASPDGTLRIGVGNADSPTEIARFDATGMISGGATPDALSTATGSAPSYSARAWVNFNGTGTIAIRASGNVSSVTDRGVGYYQVNFTTNMPDVNYSSVVTLGGGSSSFPSVPHINESAYNTRYAPVVSSFRYRVYIWNNGAAFLDMPDNTVAIFR
jgi:hypothetical protein